MRVELPSSQGVGRVDVYGLVSTPAEEVTLEDDDDAIVFEDGGVEHESPTLGMAGGFALVALLAVAAARRARR